MTAEELIKLDASEVRSSSSLMSIYKDVFKQTFGREPLCAGCTFKNDFQRLINHYSQNNPNIKIMKENKTFELKRQYLHELFSYTKYDEKKARPVTYRNYGYGLTDGFVKELFASKTEEEVFELKQKFSKLELVETPSEVKPSEVLPVDEATEVKPSETAKKARKQKGTDGNSENI